MLVLHLLKKYVPSMAIAKDLAVTEQLHLGDRCRLVVVKIRGASTRAMAERLHVSPATVRNHVQHILEKLGVHSRLEAAASA